MADRIVVLNGGNIEQVGTPGEIYNKPASTFVASFMGAPPMNMIPGKLDASGSLTIPELGEIKFQRKPKSSGGVSIGIRPEKVQISNEANGITQPFVHDFTEELGATRLVHGKLGASSFIVNLPQENQLPEGDLHVALDPDHLHIFSEDNGERIEFQGE